MRSIVKITNPHPQPTHTKPLRELTTLPRPPAGFKGNVKSASAWQCRHPYHASLRALLSCLWSLQL